MNRAKYFRGIVLLTGLFLLLITGLLVGCKGDTGPAGAKGADGTSVSLTDCNDCHHLNSLQVNEFNEIYVASLASGATVTGGAAAADRMATLSFNSSALPAGETAVSYQWTVIGGQAASFSAPTANTTTVTLAAVTDYKAELVKHATGIVISELNGTVVSDRTQIVPINPLMLEEASAAEIKLRVATASGKFYYTLVNVTDANGEAALANFAAVTTGLNSVPIDVPVLIHSASNAGGYNWTVTGPAGAVTVTDATSQLPSFTPSVAGTYTATNSVGGATLNIYAGTWQGAIDGQDANGRPTATGCTSCHNDTIAPDKFTTWKDSGHAEILTQNINDPNSHWTVSGCGPCHSVGYNTAATNNGFDEAVASTGWTFTHGDPNNWTNMLTNFAAAAKLANIQCENCHGPNVGTGLHVNGISDPERVSMNANVCGSCHGEPLRHARFQQWDESGHGNYELAVNEGVASDGVNVNANCGGCHSGQGFIRWLKELQSGDPLRTVSTFSLSTDEVQPQTCQVCHDPHIQGTLSGNPNTANLRITDNTPKLPGGFAATGVGRGAICIVCHNSRNGGGSGSLAADSFLHQDGDPQYGSLTSYSGPHEANQGDVLLGYNAYFVGSGNYRSPHSLITDTCANCHMEQTPPPPLLSYNLGGTNHGFRASLNICSNCHTTNTSLGPMLQATVKNALELLGKSIEDKIVSRNTVTDYRGNGTGCTIAEVTDLGSRGSVGVLLTGPTCTALPNERISASLGSMRGVRICAGTTTTDCLETDNLAKALWNFYLIEQDQSGGVHNPDFTFAVLGAAQFAVDAIPENPPVITD